MTHRTPNPGMRSQQRIEPLPAEFARADRAMDARVHDLLGAMDVPAGLCDRVYEMSVRELAIEPALVETGTPNLRLAGTSAARPWWAATWTRVAMAACVGVACAITWRALNQSPQQNQNGGLMANNGASTPDNASPSSDTLAFHAESSILSDEDFTPSGSVAAIDRETGYLMEAGSTDSFAEVSSEIVMLLAELSRSEM